MVMLRAEASLELRRAIVAQAQSKLQRPRLIVEIDIDI
jgi:hypothetical protein